MAEETAKRQSITADDMKSQDYISLKVGESAEFTIEKIDKVIVDKDFALSGVGFRYEVFTDEGKCLSVSSWKLWNVLRDALKNISEIKGTKISVIHSGTGLYEAKVIE